MSIYNILPLLICANGPVVVHINGGRQKYWHSHIDASISGNHVKAFYSTWHGHYLRWWWYFHLTTTMSKTKRFRLQKAQSAGNLGLLNTGNKENCSPEVPLHILAATGLEMSCHKVHGKEYKRWHRLEVRRNRWSQAKNWWGIKGKF